MSWNVPDDWGMYYYRCEYCGARCHASEGGCECPGANMAEAERPWLEDSGYELSDGTWSKTISIKVHTCRRNHKNGRIKVGMSYRRYSYRNIDDESGDSWITHHNKIISRP